MKKSLLAVILATVTGVTMAQSNVSIYGVIDTGMQSYNSGTERLTRPVNSAWNTSRLGFRGTEDLGSGLKVNFMLEGAVAPSEGTFGSTATNETFNREAWVGVSNHLGELRIGRQDVSYAQDIDAGISQANNFALRAVNGTAIELGTDQKSVIKYISPTVAGFTVQLGHASSSPAGATTDAQASQNSVFVRYDQGRMRLMAGYQKNDGSTSAAQRDFSTAGASYDFGVASVGFTYGTGDVSTTGVARSSSTMTSVKVPLKNNYAAHVVYATAKDATQASDANGQGVTVGLSKVLSARTTLYAAYTKIDNEANAKMYMTGTTAPTTGGLNTSGVMAGISHTF
jgi:predicted porin